VTLSFLRLFAQLLLVLAAFAPVQAGAVEITRAAIQAGEDGYRLDTAYSFELNPELESVLRSGTRLCFRTEVNVVRPRWYWYDDRAVSASRDICIKHDVLTHQYSVTVGGGLRQQFQTLDEALFNVRRPTRWLIAPRGALKVGETYQVSVRMGLAYEELTKPLQINAFNDSAWSFQSERKRFSYRAE
jgi:hypothetical protein